ncbi:MAG: GDP-mannose 4,6-dehydratase [Myxococcota bacterium]
MSSERIAVLGSNCFTGAHFIKACRISGATVIGFNRSAEPNLIMMPHRSVSSGEYQFYQLDINKDMDKIEAILDLFKPDYIVNFAAQGMVGQSWAAPLDWFQTNTLAMVDLHERLRQKTYLKKYLHCSTPEVYGNCSGLVDETQSFSPSSPYAVSKAAADLSLMSYHRAYNFPVVFTRAANVYGPAQQLYRIIPRSIIYFLTGRTLSLHGGGSAIRSFIHIDDVAKGTLEVLRHGRAGEAYHLATSENVSIRDLVKEIAQKVEVDFDTLVEVVGDRLGKDDAYLLNTSKINSELGWFADTPLERGLDDCIQWVKTHIEIIRKMPLNYIHKK